MNKKVFSIRDGKGQFYGPIFVKDQIGQAERDFSMVVNNFSNGGLVSQFPHDFDLWFLGEFDDQSGKLIPLDAPQHIINGVHLRDESKVPSGPGLSAVQ